MIPFLRLLCAPTNLNVNDIRNYFLFCRRNNILMFAESFEKKGRLVKFSDRYVKPERELPANYIADVEHHTNFARAVLWNKKKPLHLMMSRSEKKNQFYK